MAWWMLQHLVVSALLAGIAQIVCRIGRVGPVGRHALWLVVLLKLMTPPLVVLPWLPSTISTTLNFSGRDTATPDEMPSHAPASATMFAPGSMQAPRQLDESTIARSTRSDTAPAGARTDPSLAQATSRDRTAARAMAMEWVRAGLMWIWLGGGIVFGCVQAMRIVRVMRTVRLARPPRRDVADHVESAARHMRTCVPAIRVVAGISAPLVWCIRRPELLWPADLPHETSEVCVRGLIVHELAHLRRRDHWVGWIELAGACVWWWNPLFWYVRSQLRENAELACDAWVVDTLPHGRRAYAEALLAICAGPSSRVAPLPAVGISTGCRRLLERRLVMIMRERVPLRLSRRGLFSLALIALATLPAWAQEPSAPAPSVSAPPASAHMVSRSPMVAAAARMPRQSLPADAQRLIDRLSRQEADVRREAADKIARQRQEAIRELEVLHDVYVNSGRGDDAAAVRDGIRQLRQPAGPLQFETLIRSTALSANEVARSDASRVREGDAAPMTLVLPEPTLQGLRGRINETFTVPVVGSPEGTVWGDGIYTDDSPLAAAAVHAGIVAPGRLGFVRVTLLPGQEQYEGTLSHGVKSQSFGAWQGSYRLEADTDPSPVIRLGDRQLGSFLSLRSLRGEIGTTLTVDVVGAATGNVWGTDEYTDDSSIAAAAVHAGVLRPGERGLVKVTILPGLESYTASERNGVNSAPYQRWDGSFRLERGGPRR